MMAAGRAAELGAQVILLEKMERLANKLRITGKGRCNITNMAELEKFIQAYGRNGKFLYHCFSQFFNGDLIDFFEKRGVATMVEDDLRVFPASGNATAIADCLLNYLKENRVVIKTNLRVRKIITEHNKIVGAKGSNNEIIIGDAVIIATGGRSYSCTGSTGDGYVLARDLGHTVIPPKPGLVPLETKEGYVKEMQGLSLKDVELSAYAQGRRFAVIRGEMLVTHFGLSGPIVLTLSREIIEKLSQGEVFVSINFMPELTKKEIETTIQNVLREHGGMKFQNVLRFLLPAKAIAVFIKRLKIHADKRAGDVNRAERSGLAELLVNLKMTVKGARPIDEAMVTSGGVALNEIKPKTMESRIIKGLFFCGEVIDIDGDTGGFNLQAAFSTGCVAGQSASGI